MACSGLAASARGALGSGDAANRPPCDLGVCLAACDKRAAAEQSPLLGGEARGPKAWRRPLWPSLDAVEPAGPRQGLLLCGTGLIDADARKRVLN